MAGAVGAFLKAAAPGIAAQVSAAIATRLPTTKVAKADGDPEPPDPEVIAKEVADELDLDWDALSETVAAMLIEIAQDGVTVAFDQIGVDPSSDMLDQVNADAVSWARDRAAELVGKSYNAAGDLIDNPDADMAITDSTRDMLQSDIASAIEEGLSTDELASQLEDSYAFSEARAQNIARFEIAQADVQGNKAAYQGSGVVEGTEVILGSEHDVPDECDEAADMGVVPLDSDRGGLGDPPFHPGCVCDIAPVLIDDDTEDTE